jgi:hypothetical protein
MATPIIHQSLLRATIAVATIQKDKVQKVPLPPG